jgi:flagellin
MVINTNVSAQTGARLLADSTSMLSKSLARLSSGYKITSPEDDVAGLAVSMRLEAKMHRNTAAKTNVSNAISFSQTQDGFLSKVKKALDRMGELSILAQDASKSTSDKGLYQLEFKQLQDYVSDLGTKDFNGVSLFSSTTPSYAVTIDADGTTFGMLGVGFVFNSSGTSASTSYANVLANTTKVDSLGGATQALACVRAAIDVLANDRSSLGANIARLNYTTEQLGVLNDNLAQANSRIVDVDVAYESAQYARYNILVQAGTAMLAQANTLPQSALRLLS